VFEDNLPKKAEYMCNCGKIFPHPLDRTVHSATCEMAIKINKIHEQNMVDIRELLGNHITIDPEDLQYGADDSYGSAWMIIHHAAVREDSPLFKILKKEYDKYHKPIAEGGG